MKTITDPKRIFLSYGHDEHVALAQRMRTDLIKRGHDVWFDVDRLKPGVDWEGHIEQGLEWIADHAGGRMILLMTVHSVRRPNGYCLNELSFASYKGVPVIPVMVEMTQPPISICRKQWLDMTDCVPLAERLDRYEAKFELLIEALEYDDFNFEGDQAKLYSVLSPLDFDAKIGKHLLRFTGRQWIFDEIEAWLAKSVAQRIFLLTGEPGVGKTAISAWLCHRYDVAAFHLCEHGIEAKRDPRQCVLSIAYQLSTQLPDYQKQLINTLNLKKLDTGSDAATLFDNLIVHPLRKSLPPKSDRPVLILIDALEEVSEDGPNELANLIDTQFRNTPEWLRLLITSRPEPKTLQLFQDCYRLDIDESAAKNREDIHVYLANNLKPYASNGVIPPDTINTIAAKSEGIFLYVECIREELAFGQLSLDRLDEFPQGLGGHYNRFFRRQYRDAEVYKKRLRPVLEVIAAASEPLKIEALANLFSWHRYEPDEIIVSLGSLFPSRDGRLQPFHRSIIEWLMDAKRAGNYRIKLSEGHRRLADYGWQLFASGGDEMPEYFKRYLPQHLIALQRWEQLEKVLCDLGFFERVYEQGRKYEWMQYWQSARDYCDPGRGYQLSLKRSEDKGVEPLQVAHLSHLIGSFLRDMGLYSIALPFIERALSIQESIVKIDHPNLAAVMHDLAELYRVQHEYDKALPLYDRALQIRREFFGPNSLEVATSSHDLGEFYQDQGKYEQALQCYQEALRIREYVLPSDDPAIADCINDIGSALDEQDRSDEALPLYERALDIFRRAYGDNHPDTAGAFHNVGRFYLLKERYDEALPLLQRARNILENILSPHHPDVQISRNTLAQLYEAQGDYEKALALRWQVLKAKELFLEAEHPDVAQSQNNLVAVLEAQGNIEKTLSLFEQMLEMERTIANPDYVKLTELMNIVTVHYYNRDKPVEAVEIARRTLSTQEKYLSAVDPALSTTLDNLGSLLDGQGRREEALPFYQRALKIREITPGQERSDIITSLQRLGWCYFNLREYDSAKSAFRKALEIREEIVGKDHPEIAESLNSIVRCLQEKGEHLAAVSLGRRALDIRERQLEPGHDDIATSLNNLGLSLVCLAKPDQSEVFKEAEQYLRRAVEMKPQVANPHYWLAKLYQKRSGADDRDREVAEWRHYLDLGPPSEERRDEAISRLSELSS